MVSEENRSKYRAVVKATGIFGGAQVLMILVNLLRAKAVAFFLGTSGFGLYSMFSQTSSLVCNLTSLGLPLSAVRDISYAYGAKDSNRIAKIILSFRRLVLFTGSFGALVMVLLCVPISNWTFNTGDQAFNYAICALFVLFTAFSSAQLSLLRGVRRISDCARATVLSGFCGLLASLPFYYFFGNGGIAPSLVAGAFATMSISFLYSRKVKVEKAQMTWSESFSLCGEMIKIGVMITLANLVAQIVTWIISIFIYRIGGDIELGLYSAGIAMTNQYTNTVLNAMGADYLPRLAAIKDDNVKISEAVNQQSEVAVLILAPAMILFLTILPLAITLLLTSDFLTIITFAQWMLLGVLLKTVSWALGFLVLGKGDSKVFVGTEVGIKFISLPSYLLGYYYFGLEGVGIAFCVVYASYLALMSFVCIKRYAFGFSRKHIKIFIVNLSFTLLAFLPLYFYGYPVAYYTGGILFMISSVYSLYELNKRIDLVLLVKRIKVRFSK